MFIAVVLFIFTWSAAAQERNISLHECLELSRANNPDVVNASLDVKAAAAQKKEVFSNWFPTVAVTSGAFHAADPLVRIGLEDVLGSTDAAHNLQYYARTAAGLSGISTEWSLLNKGYVAALNVSQPLFAGGRIANGNALAALGVKAAEVNSSIAGRDNDDHVTEKYWTVVSLAEKKSALQRGLDLVASLEKDVAAAVEAGVAKNSDLMQVRIQSNDLAAKMSKLRSGERLAKMDLFNSIGLEYDILELDNYVLSDGFDMLLPPESYYRDEESIAALLDERKLLDMSVESKKLEKKMALGESLPEVALGASLGYGQLIGSAQGNGLVYAIIRIPVSDWGKTSRKLQRCQYEIDKAENTREYLDRQLLLKVNKEWMELQSAWDQLSSASDAVELTELLEMQKRDEFEAGLCTLTELLKVQSDLEAARSTKADCSAAYCNALAVWEKD